MNQIASDNKQNVRAPYSTWQEELAQSNWQLTELLDYLGLPQEFVEQQKIALSKPGAFPLRVTQSFLKKIQKGNTTDPLLLQILPLAKELEQIPGYTQDPLEEHASNPHPGLIHKYRSRALLTITHNCAIHCRYCFRQHFSYADNNPSKKQWDSVFDYLDSKPEINEIILSGGDPLAVNDHYLEWMLSKLSEIKHLKRLRIHSRLPIVLPARVNEGLLEALTRWPGQKVMVLHTNHPNEIDKDVGAAVGKLQAAKISLLNQSVLLAGINDKVETLAILSESLFEIGVMPYYLHLLDKVQGTAHFDIERARAIDIHRELQLKLAGFLVPRLVEEIAGAGSKRDVVGI